MKKHEINMLNDLLTKWFVENTSNKDKRNFFNQNKIASLLRINITKMKHWRDKPKGKGNPENFKSTKEKIVNAPKLIKTEFEDVF